ncbi:glycosyltransferase family 4 protein [Vibrio cyclitrophicus]|uniref:glycosyltransferase family 4 protein n=1 Tax=Vibrio cyclitrophicus TaxID=47951 RepID=UPI00148C298D|nr:glycosyltransferase family 4 protein [Vibrio cyclitrophicus]NOH20152.1 glycosyltransferase family 4 protein [Vibrio cyclitrophicus]
MKNVAIIGPFPDPIHGMSLANQMLFNKFGSDENIVVSKFDIALSRKLKSKHLQGKLTLFNTLLAVSNLVKLCFYILNHRGWVFYITPPQSVLGYLRLLPAIVLCGILGSRLVVHFHGSVFISNIEKANPLLRTIIKWSFSFIDSVVLLGNSIYRTHKCIFEKNDIEVCLNGVPEPKNHLKEYDKEKITVLFLSNLMKDKGIIDFLGAIGNLDSSRYHVDIAGAIEEHNYDVIKSKLSQLDFMATYHGVVSGEEKSKLFHKADVFVLPSYDEGQPLSILEAYSYGNTVITTDVGGIPDIFTDGKNGVFCQVGDSMSIFSAITGLDSKKLNLFSENNLIAYESNYTSDAFCQRVQSILWKDG